MESTERRERRANLGKTREKKGERCLKSKLYLYLCPLKRYGDKFKEQFRQHVGKRVDD